MRGKETRCYVVASRIIMNLMNLIVFDFFFQIHTCSHFLNLDLSQLVLVC